MRHVVSRSPVRAIAITLVTLGLGLATRAHADDVTGAYDVKFEQVSTNCEHPLSYPPRGSLKVSVKGDALQVDIEHTPLMTGTAAKTGKLSARSRLGHTTMSGMDGVFSIAGRINGEGMVQLVMIGEYQASGRPLCTQTWNLSGIRADKK